MLTATSETETIAGVAGVRYRTNARPWTREEAKLQEIQRTLAGGDVELPAQTTLPHLNLSAAGHSDGPPVSHISLWVPLAQRSEAAALLATAGFEVS